MSRIGKQPVLIPAGVTVALRDGGIAVKGPKGELFLRPHERVRVSSDAGRVLVERAANDRLARSLHGLTRALIQNMVVGVVKGYEERLEIQGVGYQASLEGKTLVLTVGLANALKVDPPQGIQIEVPDQTHVVIKGIDKQLVGNTAATIRALRKPEPYKGKGIRYQGEQVRRKVGKALQGTTS